MRVLILDNYDSFTFNLAQYCGELGAEPLVIRSDVATAEEALEWEVDRLVISPGPGRPENAGYSIDYVRAFAPRIPTLGVCLGHQAVAVAYGGEVGAAPEPLHGKISPIRHDRKGIFAGCDNPFVATRYHSLAITSLPSVLEACAWSEEGVIQGVRHRSLPVTGVQFHPESILTSEGKRLLGNFLALEAPVAIDP
jgi:anthranilate synthase/aminodeoxychorismate synthase-like glutamine amidotransferase